MPKRDAIRAERVRRQHIRPGVAVFGVNRADQFRIGKRKLIERPIGENVMPIKLGAHRAVENQHAAGEGFGES